MCVYVPSALLEAKLKSLQEELTDSYRQKAENAQTLLRLKEQRENDERLLIATEAQ